MGLGSKKSKLGGMMGVDLTSVNQKPEETPQVVIEKPAPVKEEPIAKKPVSREIQPTTVGGRPKFELIAGMQEKKVNFHCPEELYTAINLEAIKQKKTVKQFICEVLLEEMSSKYGFKLK